MTLEKRFDIVFAARQALLEKKQHQRYRPYVGVHKFFARRSGALFRCILLSEFAQVSLRKAFFASHDFSNLTIGDPFLGGGTSLIEANRMGCRGGGTDINPMATWIAQRTLDDLDVKTYRSAANQLIGELEEKVGSFYLTNVSSRRAHGLRGRLFKKPDAQDLLRYESACERLSTLTTRFVPKGAIPDGDESSRLHYWGYRYYREVFNPRQLLGLELSGLLIEKAEPTAIRNALATNLSDLVRFQNMLVRYDPSVLKALDIFSLHSFPVGLIQAEPNVLGILNAFGRPVGSGGWRNIVEKYARAKEYCSFPFETRIRTDGRLKSVSMGKEWIGLRKKGAPERIVILNCESAAEVNWKPKSLDAVLSDPPYFDNIQYSELMDFLFVWLRGLVGEKTEGFHRESCRSADELTGNIAEKRGVIHFAEGLSAAFRKVFSALKFKAPFVFTFHHRDPVVYYALTVAILDAGLTCTAVFPSPGEGGASIHVRDKAVARIDTIFVCRKLDGPVRQASEDVENAVRQDRSLLRKAGLICRPADKLCLRLGHQTRNSVAALQPEWNRNLPTSRRLEQVSACFAELSY